MVHCTIAVSHVHETIQSHNFSLEVVFLLWFFLYIKMVEQEDDLYATLYICRLTIMILPVHKNGETGRRHLCNLVYMSSSYYDPPCT